MAGRDEGWAQFQKIKDEIRTLRNKDENGDPANRSTGRGHLESRFSPDVRGIEFVVEGREALPEVVQARVNNMEDQMYSGFLSELDLAWVSVDDTICLWLPAPQDVPRPPPCSKRCPDYVLAAALVKPDPSKEYNCDGMPQYFLAVALRNCVQLLKLEVTDTQISLQDTAIEIAVDSYVSCMESTPSGRLFVGCHDGGVYELHYEEDDISLSSFWRPRKFRKTACGSFVSRWGLGRITSLYETQPVQLMCYDSTRHYLYALTAKRCEERTSRDYIAKNTRIHIYSLGAKDGTGDGTSAPRQLVNESLFKIGDRHRLEDVLDGDILSMHPVQYSEDQSKRLHLLLVTGTGYRIYLDFLHSSSLLMVAQNGLLLSPSLSTAAAGDAGPQNNAAAAAPRARCAAYSNGLFLLGCDSVVHCVARASMEDYHGTPNAEVVRDIRANQLSPDQQAISLDLWQIEEMASRRCRAGVGVQGLGIHRIESSRSWWNLA